MTVDTLACLIGPVDRGSASDSKLDESEELHQERRHGQAGAGKGDQFELVTSEAESSPSSEVCLGAECPLFTSEVRPPPSGGKQLEEEEEEEEEDGLYKWRLLSDCRFVPENGLEKTRLYLCDLCSVTLNSESDLKAHQLGLHINPHYLSDEDRVLGKVVDYSIQSGHLPWTEEHQNVKRGLFRCHICSWVWNRRGELKSHLEKHITKVDQMTCYKVDEVIRESRSPLEIKTLNRRPLNGVNTSQKGKDIPMVTSNRANLIDIFKLSKKKVKAEGTRCRKEKPSQSEESSHLSDGQERLTKLERPLRPDRKCKTITKALVAISFDDEEKIDLEFAVGEPEGNSSKKPVDAVLKKENEKSERVPVKKKAGRPPKKQQPVSGDDDDDILGYPPLCKKKQGSNSKLTKYRFRFPSFTDDDQTRTNGEVTPNNKSGDQSVGGSVASFGKIQRRRRKKGIHRQFTRKPRKKQQPISRHSQTQKNKNNLKSRPSKDLTGETAPKTMSPLGTKFSLVPTSMEDILPDLRPNAQQSSKKGQDKEKVHGIVEGVVHKLQLFNCFECERKFCAYNELCNHRLGCGAKRPLLGNFRPDNCKVRVNGEKKLHNGDSSSEHWEYLSNAVNIVPETTFNNMHGTLSHIDTSEGLYVRSKKTLRAVEKVKLNINNAWTTKDVWHSGGWEMSKDILSWHRYESSWATDRSFLQKLATLPWSEQLRFKRVFDVTLAKNRGRRRSQSIGEIEGSSGRRSQKRENNSSSLIPGLQLKQLGRSIKYMSASEREAFIKKQNEKQNFRFVGSLNGEWENEQLFMCSTCAMVYDELREVLHHKWEAHPYCLVAHVTFQAKLVLPPNGMMYPKLGRSLQAPLLVGTTTRGRRSTSKAAIKPKSPTTNFQCSKCQSKEFITRDGFYEHILTCGGETVSEEGSKKKSKKRGRVNSVSRADTPAPKARKERQEALERRKARFAKFDRPVVSSRNTRLRVSQISVKNDDNARSRGTRKGNIGKELDKTQNQSNNILGVGRKSESTSLRMSRRKVTERRENLNQINGRRRRRRRRSSRDLKPLKTSDIEKSGELQGDKTHFSDDSSSTSSNSNIGSSSASNGILERPPRYGKRRASYDSSQPLLWEEIQATKKIRSSRLSLDSKIKVLIDNDAMEFIDLTETEETGSDIKSTIEAHDRLNGSQSKGPTTLDTEAANMSNSAVSFVVPRRRGKRLSSAPVLSNCRVVFPLEVKLSAIERIATGGETQSQVASDLQCPSSTIASWWHRRHSLRAKMAQMDRRRGEQSNLLSSDPKPANEGKVKMASNGEVHQMDFDHSSAPNTTTAVVLYQRNYLLQAMKKAFEKKSAFSNRYPNSDSDVAVLCPEF